ncbi:hypothetical protein MMC17_006438 [Xylographa soralifera]|nr:hypothetical protein [Xylographa soralifera]
MNLELDFKRKFITKDIQSLTATRYKQTFEDFKLLRKLSSTTGDGFGFTEGSFPIPTLNKIALASSQELLLQTQALEAAEALEMYNKEVQEAWEEEAQVDVNIRISRYFEFEAEKQRAAGGDEEDRIEREIKRRMALRLSIFYVLHMFLSKDHECVSSVVTVTHQVLSYRSCSCAFQCLLSSRKLLEALHVVRSGEEFNLHHSARKHPMDSSFQDFHDDPIPSYEESVQQGATQLSSVDGKSKPSPEHPQSLVDRLSSVRFQRINAIIDAHINPLLEQQADSGLYRSVFILVPSNTTTLQAQDTSNDIVERSANTIGSSRKEEVIGFREGEYVKLVRLHGDEYNAEFWRQPTVISELNNALQTKLRNAGHKIAAIPASQSPSETANTQNSSSPTTTKKNYFGWRKREKETIAVDRNLPASGWRFEKEEALMNGEVRIKSGLQDVSLRVENEMCLYETKTGKAVVVSFEM